MIIQIHDHGYMFLEQHYCSYIMAVSSIYEGNDRALMIE